jgi:predicted ATPase
LADPSLVAQIVATTVGVQERPGRPILDTLVASLRPRDLLLVLDNCEHLVEPCGRHLRDPAGRLWGGAAPLSGSAADCTPGW